MDVFICIFPFFPLFYFVVENLQLGFITSSYLGRKPVLLSELMSGCVSLLFLGRNVDRTPTQTHFMAGCVQPSLLGEEGRPDS